MDLVADNSLMVSMQNGWPFSFYFSDVDRIAAFQVDQLRKAGASMPELWPQAMMAATEQGWQVCFSEETLNCAMSPSLLLFSLDPWSM